VFKDDQWEVGRAVFHNRDKSLLIWVNEKDHVRISAMCQGVDIGATFDRLCRAVTHIEQGCKFAHDRHLGYFTSCPTNLGTALLASVLLSLPRLKKNREVFESIVDQYQLKVSGFEPEQDAEETNDISESKQEIDASKIEEAVVPEPQKKEEEDTILCISNKICLGRSERQLVQDMINCVHELIDAELEREKDEAPIDKDSVARLPLSLPSIKEVLTKAFGDFDTVHMRNIVVAIGNTGCGKSTLLSSMVLGPEALA
jgi:creatine kinase/arginine kinase